MLDTRACHLLVGALLAIALVGSPARAVHVRWSALCAAGIAGLILLDTPAKGVADLTSLLTVGLLFVCVSARVRWLELRPLRWVGERAYGVYLYHVPVLMLCREWTTSWWVLAPVAIAVTLTVAAASYRWLETPVRAWGRRSGAVREETQEPRAAQVLG